MPSPFPGMNPYLEHAEVWHDFHETFMPRARDAMMKPRANKETPDVIEGYAFNNVSDSISKTFAVLANMLDLEDVSDNAEEADVDEVAIMNA